MICSFTRKESDSSVNVFLISPTIQLIEMEKIMLRVGNTWKLLVDTTCVTQVNTIMHQVSCSWYNICNAQTFF